MADDPRVLSTEKLKGLRDNAEDKYGLSWKEVLALLDHIAACAEQSDETAFALGDEIEALRKDVIDADSRLAKVQQAAEAMAAGAVVLFAGSHICAMCDQAAEYSEDGESQVVHHAPDCPVSLFNAAVSGDAARGAGEQRFPALWGQQERRKAQRRLANQGHNFRRNPHLKDDGTDLTRTAHDRRKAPYIFTAPEREINDD